MKPAYLPAPLLLALALAGCDWIDNIHRGNQVVPTGTAPASTVGRWANRYPGHPDLVGVQVRQFPDAAVQAQRYQGRHPATVIYVFKNGRANRVNYEPDATILQDYWFPLAPGDPLWNNLEPPPSAAKGSS